MSFRSSLTAAIVVTLLPAVALAQRPGEQVAPAAHDPDSALLVTDDLRNFSRALSLLKEDESDTLAVIADQYFARASPGLRAYAARYDVTPQDLLDALRRYPRYYASLSTLERDVAQTYPRIHAAYAELKRLHPGALFPPVYFFVGNLGPGGLTRPEGLLISAELFGATDARDLGELTAELPRVQPVERLPHLVAHELLHYQQAAAQGIEAYRAIFGERQSLLALAIREGSADFLASLISGGTIYADVHRFGLARERELWLQFQQEMHQRDPGDWMFNRPTNADWPMDLGYFMGYRIAESFYQNAPDKRQAVQDILGVTDYEAFLRASGYAERFR